MSLKASFLLSLTILSISISFSPLPSHCVTPGPEGVQGSSPEAYTGTSTAYIIVDKVEGGCVYSTDGRKFQITPETKVTSRRKAGKIRTAKLIFRNGVLFSITLN